MKRMKTSINYSEIMDDYIGDTFKALFDMTFLLFAIGLLQINSSAIKEKKDVESAEMVKSGAGQDTSWVFFASTSFGEGKLVAMLKGQVQNEEMVTVTSLPSRIRNIFLVMPGEMSWEQVQGLSKKFTDRGVKVKYTITPQRK